MADYLTFSEKIPVSEASTISWTVMPCFNLFTSSSFSSICSRSHQYGHLVFMIYQKAPSSFLLR